MCADRDTETIAAPDGRWNQRLDFVSFVSWSLIFQANITKI